jgi:hypothetical protein
MVVGPLVLFLPDLLAAGYLGGTRFGAHIDNVAYTTVLPTLVVGLGWWRHNPIVLVVGLVWLSHIGMDRMLGFGLKYSDRPQHTHLGSGRHTEAGSVSGEFTRGSGA